ncbi:ankyrin repeat-containing domain protein [Morchella snyderi]|nr:ankyrin repeat-containing domain protein [Morchella snyderi]
MEVAASVVGLLAAATNVYTTLSAFLTVCHDAPTIAQTTSDEVRDFRYALLKLRDYVWQSKNITPLGRATTDTGQLILTLASAMTTLAQVEKTLDPLLAQPKMDYIRRIRWGFADSDLSKLLTRIQSHKLTLNLLLTIWLSESAAQAEASNDLLNDTIKGLLDPRYRGTLQSFDPSTYDSSINNVLHGNAPGDISHVSTEASNATSADTMSLMTVNKTFSIMSGRSLRSKLLNTKPYSSFKAFNSSAESVLTSQRATPWSEFTIGSNASVFSLPFTGLDLDRRPISEVKEIHRIALPVDGMALYNDWWYPETNTTRALEFQRANLCILLSVFGIEAGNSRTGADRSAGPPTALDSLSVSPSLPRFLSKSLTRHINGGGEYSSFLSGQLLSGIANNNLQVVDLILAWCTQKRFGLAIGDDLAAAMRIAVQKERILIAERLLDWGSCIEVLHREPDYGIFELALKSGSLDLIKLFLVRGVDVEKGYGNPACTPLQWAVIRTSHELAELLLDRGVNIEESCNLSTPLELSLELGNHEMVALMLDRGANPEKGYGKSPLTPLQAVAMGKYPPSFAQLLVGGGANIEGYCEEERRKPLQIAMGYSNYSVIKVLIKNGADPNHGYPYTPLQGIAMGNFPDPIRLANLLLAGKPKVEGCTEQERRTPLQIAIDKRDHAMVKLLISCGADINKQYNDAAHTAISKVIGYGDLAMFKILLPIGSHMEREYGSPQRTLLQMVVEMRPLNSLKMVRYLLDAGANIDGHTRQEPRTPLQVAVQIDDITMAQLLIVRGAKTEELSEHEATLKGQFRTVVED